MKRCPIATKTAGSKQLDLNDFFTLGYERLLDLCGLS